MNAFAEACSAIADHVQATAIRSGGRATWIHSAEAEHALPDGRAQAIAAGPTYYDGLAGIAYFLWVSSRHLERPDLSALAIEATRQALHTLNSGQSRRSRNKLSFFCGDIGVAWTAWTIGRDAHEPWIEAAAQEILDSHASRRLSNASLDYLVGIAGCIPPLLQLSSRGAPRAGKLALELGDRLVKVARVDAGLATWPTLDSALRPLTGLSHGASGIALALATLYESTGDERYRRTAIQALRYEDTTFDAEERNWPDFRKPTPDVAALGVPFGTSWCHGAPGIGLARAVIASALDGEPVTYVDDAAATTSAALVRSLDDAETPFQICHGVVGLALALDIMTSGRPESAHARALVHKVAQRGIELHGRRETWTEGSFSQWLTSRPGLFDASLMTGIAGTGLFYLRLALDKPPFQPALAPGSPA